MQTPSLSSAEEDAVWQVVVAFNQAFTHNDVDAYFAFVDEAITVIIPGNPYRIEGLAADREEFTWGLRRGVTTVGFFQAIHPHIQLYGEVAVVSYSTRGSYGSEAPPKLRYFKETNVLVRRDGTWKVVHIHVSVAVPTP